jgi:hypothetical protein
VVPDPWDDAEEAMSRAERQARRDQVEEEAEAERLRLMKRSLTDVAWEAMQQGHRIRLTWPGGADEGIPTAAFGDLVVLRLEQRVVAVNLDAVTAIEVVERGAGRGSTGDRTVESFVAFCRMVEGTHVSCHTVGNDRVDGTLVATATDHLYIRPSTGGEVAVVRSRVATISVAGDFPFSF